MSLLMLRPGELEIAKNLPPSACSPAEAQQYTRWLATHHYENFTVASWLLPKELHQHFYNLYAFCRWADDLGDEIPQSARALELLDWWERELDECFSGRPSHPVFIALRETILAKNIPKQPFADLLKAFRQDQTVKRYASWEDVLGYCRYSANPVGRLVLYICGYSDAQRHQLSDATCTALQLANFWQDVSRDVEKGRIYIPLDEAAACGISEDDIVEKRFDARYANLMENLIARTRILFAEGMPLAKQVDRRLGVDLEMFSRGGLAVLDAIEKMGFDTLHHRPAVGKGRQVLLLGRAVISGFGQPTDFAGRDASKSVSDVQQSYEECNRIVRRSHSNFYYAFFLLPKPKRNGLAALYAFMRAIDDVADESDSVDAKSRGLATWRNALDTALATDRGEINSNLPADAAEKNGLDNKILPALVDTMRRYKMPARYLHELIAGAEMDLTICSYATYERLRQYCYRVAGTVGLACTHVFGFQDTRALDLSEKLGLAFQLTNIIRDVREDFMLGRVYIPHEDLERFGVSPQSFAEQRASSEARDLLRFEAERAWSLYEEGSTLLNCIDEDSRPALWLLVRTYSALLARIESLDFEVLNKRVRLGKSEKLAFIAKAKFGRLTEENILEKRDGDRRRAGGTLSRRRAG
ncbi:MAG TPA: squalene synthase HpnC [Candidatus Dormibacteraeota bacterium]|nr:squalene synthase HpnC [Candidatus Dormibacteraeota bacterium]